MPRPTCTIKECPQPSVGHGWCVKHYTRWRRTGDPLTVRQLHGVSPEERFSSKVNKAGPIPEQRPDLGPCWVWLDALLDDGYGLFWTGERQERPHHWAYEHFIGPIPDGYEPDHLCRNRACSNPGHLEAVTKRENILRGEGMGARNARKTHCVHGHPFDEAKTIRGRVERICRTCQRAANRRSYRRRKGSQ